MDLSAYDLYMFIHKRNIPFPEVLIAYITIAAVKALDFLQQNGVYHRDIKPQNILLNREGEIKLCDFGESKIIKNSIASSYVGTIPYWPPERFKAVQRYSIEADIWSIGITMAELAYGKLPYIDEFGRAINDIIALQRAIMDITSTVIVERCFKQHNYSKNLKDFACLCLSEAESRPKSCELKRTTLYQHYQGVVNTSVVKQHLVRDILSIGLVHNYLHSFIIFQRIYFVNNMKVKTYSNNYSGE
jgi:serine/threonine protein kinase